MAPQNTDDSNLQEVKVMESTEEDKRRVRAGTVLSQPPPGEEIVITGMAGRFPNSDDVYHYRQNLLNKMDMVSDDNRRWEPIHPEIPQRTGKINFVEKFDSGFFGIHYRQAHSMDPMCRQVLERAFEAIADAGFHPNQLRGTRTGVFIGACFSESEKTWFYDKLESPTFGITGCTRSMQAQQISYCLGLQGPSYMVDTACSSSLYALEHAYRAIREGRCEAALVGGASLCLHPIVSLQFARLGVLSLDGSCKSFDADANGYARSETIAMVFLQKTKDAKRIYAQVVHAKANCDGYKEQGITYPSGPMQRRLLEDMYQECNIDPGTIDFLEAHATGTKVGDPEEIMAMDEVFCTARNTPLLVGSIKSSVGHTEPASGMCSLVKVLLGMENNCLLPNINYTRPREGAEALEKGRMKIVTETMPWPSHGTGLAAVNSFGFGGSNCHLLLKRFAKSKFNSGQPRDDLPRLVCISGRTQESLARILNDIRERPLDAEHIGLLHEIFRNDTLSHIFRGFAVASKSGELVRSFKYFDGLKEPLVIVFSGANEEWLRIGSQLYTIPLFAATVQKVHKILIHTGINITEVINVVKPRSITEIIVGTVTVQVGLVKILNILEVPVDYIVGYSVGEVAASYADDCLSLDQAVMASYYIGNCLSKTKQDVSISYNVELDKNQLQSVLPVDLEIIAHNNESNFTISGPPGKMDEFVHNLKNKGIPAKKINSFGLHSKKLQQINAKLLQCLKEVIPKPKQRSSKWINVDQLTYEASKYASAEYFTKKLLSPILLTEVTAMLPKKPALLEIGSELIQIPHLSTLHLFPDKSTKHSIESLLYGLGRIYQIGYNPKVKKLYPKVQWPVSVGTPMISPLIKWNHSDDWFVALYKAQERMQSGERVVSFGTKETDWTFLSGHVIDGRNLVPATAYLCLVWETYSMVMARLISDMHVVFENVKFHRATTIPKNGTVELNIMIQKATSKFEVAEMGQPVCSGSIYIPDNVSDDIVKLPQPVETMGQVYMSPKDIYKELKLRGYNYSGIFRGLKQSDVSGRTGLVEWDSNWIGFMDNMLQMKLLQEDTRNLYVPTGIKRLVIDAKAHLQYVKRLGEKPVLPIYYCKTPDVIRSGAIEIRGLQATSIARRKPLGEPILEMYKFVPFEEELSEEQSTRVHCQLLLENSYGIKIRVVEVIDEAARPEAKPLGPMLHQALSDQPVIQPQIVVLSKEHLELTNVTVEDKKLTSEIHTCSLVIASNILRRPETIKQALGALKENGMILSREDVGFQPEVTQNGSVGLDILSVHQTASEKLVLLRKTVDYKPPTVIDVSNSINNFDWLPTLQSAVKNDEKVLVLSQNMPRNGILGFVNCLRREPGGMGIKCVFIIDKAPEFDINNEFYSKQLQKGLTINIFKDGKWGSYRHLPLENAGTVEGQHVFNNVTVRGDLSSLRWIEGQLTRDVIPPPEKILIQIYCAAINFRDIMTASGRINNDVITRNRLHQYNVQGFEFSGRNSSGKRVMGMVTSGALASMTIADSYLTWEIPDEWSMEDAATIPVAYGTVMQCLVMVARIQTGQSILIHAGSGGVGQAAINIALYYKCNIFTTVGTPEKRKFIKEQFSQIPESHIGNSRDSSFEQMIFQETNGKGVDIVLNSLAEEKLQASARCLAPGGKFIEIGKFDLASNNPVGLKVASKSRSFHGVMLDAFFVKTPAIKSIINNLIDEGIKTGAIKPLSRTIFEQDEVEKAFRYMAGGKHTGKVIVKIRPEEPLKTVVPEMKLFKCIPRFYGNPDGSYVIYGGLGGFGLELADWLVTRGVKKLMLISRQGLKTGYQASRIRIWDSYKVKTIISTANITTREGCISIINDANQLGPVAGVFNLAVELKDGLLENQNQENFVASLAPKAVATVLLDEVTREMCPDLEYFVVFSSVSCGRGNVGQTNYGMANSIMERVCEQRKMDGYPGLAIQWGAIGEVGLVAEMQELQTEIEIGGTLQQRVTSCLNVMDIFLRQNEPIVSSIVVAEKKSGAAGAGNIIDAVKNIMGIRDLKTISQHATLPELGMDSMMAVEIKQTLEREYEVFLTAQDIRSMTFIRLMEIAHAKMLENENRDPTEDKERLPEGIYLLLRYMGDEQNARIPLIRLPSLIKEKSMAPKVFLLPGIEGMADVMEPLASNLAFHALCLQYVYSDQCDLTVEDIAKSLLPRIEENLPKTTPFTLVSYSYGCIIALELASLLEQEGRMGRVILIDGSPAMFKEFVKLHISENESQQLLQTVVLCALMQLYMPLETVLKHKKDIYNCETLEDRVDLVLSYTSDDVPHSKKYQRQVCLASCAKTNSVVIYQPNFRKLRSMVKLFKPSRPTLENFDHDYKLQELCENPVEVTVFEGNHLTILKNPQVGYAINTIVDTSTVYFKQSIFSEQTEVNSLTEVSVKQI